MLPRQPNQSLIDGLACLQELAASGEPVGGRELARRLGLEVTRAHRLARTLAHLGLVEQLPDKRFVPGSGMHVLSAQSLFGSGLVRAAAAVLEDFTPAPCSVALGVLWREEVSYLLFRRPGMTVAESLGAAGVYPARKSAIGRVLSAKRTPRQVLIRRSPGQEASLAVPVGRPAIAGLALAGPISDRELPALVAKLTERADAIEQRRQQWLTGKDSRT